MIFVFLDVTASKAKNCEHISATIAHFLSGVAPHLLSPRLITLRLFLALFLSLTRASSQLLSHLDHSLTQLSAWMIAREGPASPSSFGDVCCFCSQLAAHLTAAPACGLSSRAAAAPLLEVLVLSSMRRALSRDARTGDAADRQTRACEL